MMTQSPVYFKAYCEANREKRRAAHKEYYAKNKEKILERTSEYKKRNLDKNRGYNREYERKWRARNPDLQKSKRRRHTLLMYGLDDVKYQKILDSQNGVCAICGRLERAKNKRLHVDHDHDSGIVRGLLCSGCNVAIGFFEENISMMENAIAYLKKFMEARHG